LSSTGKLSQEAALETSKDVEARCLQHYSLALSPLAALWDEALTSLCPVWLNSNQVTSPGGTEHLGSSRETANPGCL